MTDEIPQDIILEMEDVCRAVKNGDHGRDCQRRHDHLADCGCGYNLAWRVVGKLDALCVPKDPAWEIAEIIEAKFNLTGTQRMEIPGIVRAAYADHFKQDAERERATRALSDWTCETHPHDKGGKTFALNREVRRLYGWDRER